MTSISIIIPTHNRAELVIEAIASCLPAPPPVTVEVIVVDDGSTDTTAARLRDLQHVTAIHLGARVGHCAARNVGLEIARGKYLKFLDSDDLLEQGSLRDEVRVAEDESADMVVSGWTDARVAGDALERSGIRKPPEHWEPRADVILAGKAAVTSAVLYRRAYVAGLRWDPSIPKLADWDWFCQAALLGGKIVSRPQSAYIMRDHPGARVSSGASMLQNAICSHAILGKIESTLLRRGELTESRRKRLAQYYYKELRVLALHDPPRFGAAVEHVYELDPSFVPIDEEGQIWMRWGCRWLGVRRALTLHSRIKRALRRVGT